MTSKSLNGSFPLSSAIFWYVLAGFWHEIAHVNSMMMSMMMNKDGAFFSYPNSVKALKSFSSFALKSALGRSADLRQLFPNDEKDDDGFLLFFERSVAISRAVAVFASAILFLWSLVALREKQNTNENRRAKTFAFAATLFDAICSDVLFSHVGSFREIRKMSSSYSSSVVYCGNFGIVLLNAAWCSQNGERAYDLLEKMVNVTMMRGAQSGGIVTFEEEKGEGNMRGVRSRVVNMKRTDLSKLLRSKTERESKGKMKLAEKKAQTRIFCGHTRFATTSKATFDGTHPHQWSPKQDLLVYGLKQTKSGSTRVSVENFITHNGDFDAFQVNRKWNDQGSMNLWLESVLKFKPPSVVDSASIAGVVDLIRAQGCFALAARFSACFMLKTSDVFPDAPMPTLAQFEDIGKHFEKVLDETLIASNGQSTVQEIGFSLAMREKLTKEIIDEFEKGMNKDALKCLDNYLDEEMGAPSREFVRFTVNAFFDNDSLFTMKYFLTHAKGSFGLMVTCSLDAHRQLCVAARGQTISVAFYPKKGLICYGSEQAAVKAGLSVETPNGDILASVHGGEYGDDNAAIRLDLDDLNGEICLLDWGADRIPAVSYPNSHLEQYPLMGGSVNAILAKEGEMRVEEPMTALRKQKSTENIAPSSPRRGKGVSVDKKLFHRMTRLEGNELIKMLPKESDDPVLTDIADIPRILKNIQDDWRNKPQGSMSLNRLTAWNLARCLKKRLARRVNRTIKSEGSIDVVVTGCEVSLWLAEQFASDLQTAFPRLRVKAISSNKILGLWGQDLPVPSVGFTNSKKTDDFTDAIVIIVSHSGGTFAPLATSNLLVSSTNSIFVVASEWDTQIGKQLRAMKSEGEFDSRIFTTDVGVRPAEPCSISVAATQQLLTQIFLHMSLVILDNADFRKYTNAYVTKHDLSELEKCNQMNIAALEEIVGYSASPKKEKLKSAKEDELRKQGDDWADHVLEGVKGWIMSFVYIVGTVTAGYPLITGVAVLCGLATTWAFYITRFFDALIYAFLPQISITIIRLIQGRNLLHRMTARTIVIGDIPWVSQCADAFLSKIFACSYSAAGITVLSGNTNDHLVHRHTHRVVRGALLIVGRPDGRLSGLTSAEATTSLSLSQASSIQSIGGTCESITIGHSPYKLPLSKNAIFLSRHRPKYLCEKYYEERTENNLDGKSASALLGIYSSYHEEHTELSVHKLNNRNAVALLTNACKYAEEQRAHILTVFKELDTNQDGRLSLSEFTSAYKKLDTLAAAAGEEHIALTDAQIAKLFRSGDRDTNGTLDFDEFSEIINLPEILMLKILEADPRNAEGLLMVEPSHEEYFGQVLRKSAPPQIKPYTLMESQEFSMKLYEARIASLQRFVAMTVLFHQTGTRVQRFWRKVSFGYLGYRTDRTHSIMRIATTASPVSGAEVRDRRHFIALVTAFNSAVSTIRRVHYEFVEGVNLSRKRVLRRNNDFSNSTHNSAGESEGEDLSYRGRGGKSAFQELLLRRAGSV